MLKLCGYNRSTSTVVVISKVAILSILLFFSGPARAQVLEDAAYGAYGHFPIGSTRVLAMGGAFVGLADDASAVVTNPAGLSMARSTFDATGGENRIVNREVFFGDNTEDREGLPYTAQFRAGALRLGPLGLGVAYSRPYALDYNAGDTLPHRQILKIESYDAAASLAFFDMVSIGVTSHTERVLVAFKNSDGTLIESKRESTYPTAGILFRLGKDASAGITYSPERRYNIDEALDGDIEASAGGIEWFHDVVIPAKITMGITMKSGSKLRLVGDIDVYQPVKNGIFVGGSASDPNDRIMEEQKSIFHGGFEFFVQKSKNLDFIWRGGGYNEPKRVQMSSDRLHFTMGVEVRFWFVVLAASYDQAPGFSNVAQSVGITFGAL